MKTATEIALEYVSLPFVGKLHEYQVEDINRHALTKSCGLFLDLGLGKTVVSAVIGAYKLIKEDYFCCYVLCPETLITQWVETLEAMGLETLAYRATPAKRKKLDRDVDFLVMSYQIFQKDYNELKDVNAYFIIDEATVMCNPQNVLYKMLNGGTIEKKVKVEGKLIPEIKKREFNKINNGCALLTATPINKPEDAYGLIRILSPDKYRNYSQFLRCHVEKYDYFDNPKEYFDLDILKENLLEHATLRSTADYIDLPPIIFKTIKYDLAPKHLALYDKLLEERMIELDGEVLIEALQATALYNWAQKIVFHPEEGGYKKLPTGVEIVDGLVDAVKQFIIVGNYRMTNNKFMERYDIGASYGAIPSKKKAQYIKDFGEGTLRGMALHPRSGGFGLNLHMCQHIFFPELPITPREFSQVCGRCYRQGQKETVVITVLVARGTIQETLFRRIQDKDDLMKEVIDTPRSLVEDLNMDVISDTKKSREEIFKELRGERAI